MLCLLCMDDFPEVLNVFTSNALQCNIFEAITKHFWLRPVRDDPLRNCICIPCWLKLETFHSFYLTVEEAHKSHSAKVGGLSVDKCLEEPATLNDFNDVQIKNELAVRKVIDNFIDVSNYLEQDVKLENSENLEITVDPINNQHSLIYNNDESKESSENSKTNPIDTKPEFSRRELRKRPSEVNSTSNLNEDSDSDSGSLGGNSDDDCSTSSFSEKGAPKNVPRSKPKNRMKTHYKPEREEKMELSKEFDEQISKHMKLTCNLCSANLPDFDELKKHFRADHQQNGYAYCCEKQFFKRGHLVDHILIHLNPQHFKCTLCEKNLTGRRSLSVHMEVHKEKPKMYQCELCSKTFLNSMGLKRHKNSHIPKDERSFVCDDCGKLFVCKYTLKSHHDNVHQTSIATVCDICGLHLKNKRALKLHLLAHEGITIPVKPKPQQTCPKCGLRLKNRYCLNRHIGLMHSEEDPQICDNCGKTYANPSALQRHINDVHAERKHQCSICDKSFKRPSYLAEHMATHSTDYSISCPECEKKFNCIANMTAHKKRIHDGYVVPSKDIEQECTTCGAKLKNRYSLSRHIASMHPEVPNPQTCETCSKTFPNLFALKNHIYKKHNPRRRNDEEDGIGRSGTFVTSMSSTSNIIEILSASDSSHDVIGNNFTSFP